MPRIDLHCHSEASNRAAEAALQAISCPECYSKPQDVHAQATRRGMHFVTLTDHDTLAGAQQLAHLPNFIPGEELTTWFPEDDCKLHLLVFGLTETHHTQLQSRAKSIYEVAAYVEHHQLAHAVAHPIYRQNDRLERWHLERLLLLFKGFECLNGAHSPRHRQAFEPVLDTLDRPRLDLLSRRHHLRPHWPDPWRKSRTAGSDDHGLLNVGRTWTEFPNDVTSPAQLLEALRTARCSPAGEPGSAIKLAHTFYSVAVRYYDRHILAGRTPNPTAQLLQMLVGAKPAPTKTQKLKLATQHITKKTLRRLRAPFTPSQENEGTALLKQLFLDSARKHAPTHPDLHTALTQGLPPLGEHQPLFDFISHINRDVTQGLAAAIHRSIDHASFTHLFDAIAALAAHQFTLLPYYFALFHQNKERHLLAQITGRPPASTAPLKIALFTDTYDDTNGVARFVRDLSTQAHHSHRSLTIYTCSQAPSPSSILHPLSSPPPPAPDPNRINFPPLLSRPFPYYPDLRLTLPPILDILQHADRAQYDAVHLSTPGPMGLAGYLVAKMLRVPLLLTHHTDFPAYAQALTHDHRIAHGVTAYLHWLYPQAHTVFSRSQSYLPDLADLGVPPNNLRTHPPGVDTAKFHPRHKDPKIFSRLGITHPKRLLYVGRISKEKNLPFLAQVLNILTTLRNDTALILAGAGPHLPQIQPLFANLPAHFLGHQSDEQLPALYASADLFLFPSRTDTLGQVVLEAQASALPAIVTPQGGPRELIHDPTTGLILPTTDPTRWAQAIHSLLNNPDRLTQMSQSAHAHAQQFSFTQTFDHFWQAHHTAAFPHPNPETPTPQPTPTRV